LVVDFELFASLSNDRRPLDMDKTASEPTHLEFQNTIEGVLLRTLGPQLNTELREKLRKEGLDVDKPLLPAYPAADFHRWVRVAAAHVWPNVPETEAVRAFGRRTVDGLAETLLGKAFKISATLLGPRRSLHRITRTFRTNNNYIDVAVVELGPTSLDLTFNEVHGLPTYYQGVLEGGVSATGAKNHRVNLLGDAGRGAKYRVEWDA
jgi:uncharacterized protein (TIGR02265 family)